MLWRINLPDEAFNLIGRVVAEWAGTELQLNLLLTMLIRYSGITGLQNDLKRAQGFSRRLKLYRLYIRKLYVEPAELQAVESLFDRINTCHDRRDWVAHAIIHEHQKRYSFNLADRNEPFKTETQAGTINKIKEVLFELLCLKEDFVWHILDVHSRFEPLPERQRLLTALQSRPTPSSVRMRRNQLRSSLGLPPE